MKVKESKNPGPDKKPVKTKKKNGKISKPSRVKLLAVKRENSAENGIPTIGCNIPKAYPIEYTVEVSNLPPSHKEVDIIEAFNKYGSITYVQKLSEKKAIIAFLKPEEASLAASKATRVARIENKVLTVKLRSKKTQEVEDGADRKIFVSNTSKNTTEDDIKKHFESCGEISFVRQRDRNKSKVFVVEFTDNAAAAEAALRLHNSILKDAIISVRLKSRDCVPWYPSRTVMLLNTNNLDKLEGSVVREIFMKCGEIQNCDVLCGKERLAVITFMKKESAAKALQLNGQTVNGLTISVELYATQLQKFAVPKKIDGNSELLELAKAKKRKVYIKKIPEGGTEKQIKQLFERCGPIEKVEILPERGAIIEFSDSDGYCNAFVYHLVEFMGQNLYLTPYSEEKPEMSERKKQYISEMLEAEPKKIKKNKIIKF